MKLHLHVVLRLFGGLLASVVAARAQVELVYRKGDEVFRVAAVQKTNFFMSMRAN